jgi:hypothetical protein
VQDNGQEAGVIEINEKALPRMIEGVAVIAGVRDGQRVYVARKGDKAAWGITQREAVASLLTALHE